MRVALALWITAVPAGAEIYRYTDDHGVLSFTDDLSKVPSALRPQAEVVPLAPAVAPRPEPSGVVRAWWRDPVGRWVPWLIGTAAVAWLLPRFGGGLASGRVVRLLLKLAFVALLGAAIYTFIMSRPDPKTPTVPLESLLPTIEPLQRARQATDALERAQQRQGRAIDALDPGVPKPPTNP